MIYACGVRYCEICACALSTQWKIVVKFRQRQRIIINSPRVSPYSLSIGCLMLLPLSLCYCCCCCCYCVFVLRLSERICWNFSPDFAALWWSNGQKRHREKSMECHPFFDRWKLLGINSLKVVWFSISDKFAPAELWHKIHKCSSSTVT